MAVAKKGKILTEKTPIVYLHTHWDREWYQPFRGYQVRLAEVVDAILDRLDSGVLPCFILDGQTVLLDDYLSLRPEREPQLRRLIQSEKLKIGPWYVMPDEFLVSGESLIRNLKWGIQSSECYGQSDQFCGYLPDTFGHSADMPTILKQCGLDNAIVWRGVSPKNAEFLWESPSGESVFSYFLVDGYFQMMMHVADDEIDLGDAGKSGALLKLRDKLSDRAASGEYLLPIGGDHLGPLGKYEMSQLAEILPNAKIETPDVFMTRLQKNLKKLEVISGELVNQDEAFLLPGVYSSRMYLKQSNRRLEHALVHRWEPLQAMLKQVSGDVAYAGELNSAWQSLLLNHPHDSICGCSVDAVHTHNEVRFEEVESLYESVKYRIQKKIAENLSTPNHWLVFNTSQRDFTGVMPIRIQHEAGATLPPSMQLAQCETILQDVYRGDFMQVPLAHKTIQESTAWAWVENIPALGACNIEKDKFPVLDNKRYFAISDGKKVIENDFYSIVVAPDGTFQVNEKKSGKLYKSLHTLRDMRQQGDSYNAAPVPGAAVQTGALKSISAWQNGPLVAGLNLQYEIAGHVVNTKIWLEAGSPLVFFESAFRNTVPDHLLQVGFDTGKPIQSVEAESHFSTIKRTYDPAYRIENEMPVAAWKELKTNTGPIQRFIRVNGQAFFTEGLCEYEVTGETLHLTLLRAFGMLSKGDTGVRGAQAGPPLPTPGGQCLNRPSVSRYAWAPASDWSESDLAYWSTRFYGCVDAVLGRGKKAAAPFQLLAWDNDDIEMTACYLNESGQLTLRLLNRSQQKQTLQFKKHKAFSQYQFVSALGTPLMSLAAADQSLSFESYALKTLVLS